MFRIFRPNAERRQKKYGQFWQISIVVRYIVIISSLILLPLDEYMYDVVDDFTPAYPSNTSTPTPGPQTTPRTPGTTPSNTTTSTPTTTPKPTSGPTTSTKTTTHNTTTESTTSTTTTTTTTKKPNATGPITDEPNDATTTISPKRSARALWKTFAGKDLAPIKLSEWGSLPPAFRVERFVESPDEVDNSSKTRLSDLLILYPCCTTILIILGMEMCGQMLLDPMTKWTNFFLIVLCIGLSTLAFIVSLMAALRTAQVIMTVIAVLSGVFLVLEIIDLCLLRSS